MEAMNDGATWRTSRYSGSNGGNCVEAGSVPGAVLVRDTKDRDGVVMTFAPDAWRRFAASLKNAGHA
jgi:hypothetical protein